jgi:outer membrane protein TolC
LPLLATSRVRRDGNPLPPAGHAARKLVVLGSVALLAGCAERYANEGFDAASATAAEAVSSRPVWIRSEDDARRVERSVAGLLAKPLTVDGAVEIALVNNRTLQVSFAELGIRAADLAEVSRPPNPGLSFKRISDGSAVDIERQFGTNALAFLTRPFAYDIESRRFEAAKLRAARDILATASATRRAFYDAVAARQVVAYAEQALKSAEAQFELAKGMVKAGNWGALELAREQAFHAETVALAARARLAGDAARERLIRLLGLPAAPANLTLPQRLPDLPATPSDVGAIEARAVAERLDIRAAKAETEALAGSLGLTRATRLIDVLEASAVNDTAGDGYEIRLEVPIFDFGEAKVVRAENIYMRSMNRLAAIANEARSEARVAYAQYRTAYELAKSYREVIVPARKRISDEMLLRYNGMLASVFELLIDAREQIAAVTAAIEAQRDFWLAESKLRFVTLIGDGPAADVRDPMTSE